MTGRLMFGGFYFSFLSFFSFLFSLFFRWCGSELLIISPPYFGVLETGKEDEEASMR